MHVAAPSAFGMLIVLGLYIGLFIMLKIVTECTGGKVVSLYWNGNFDFYSSGNSSLFLKNSIKQLAETILATMISERVESLEIKI